MSGTPIYNVNYILMFNIILADGNNAPLPNIYDRFLGEAYGGYLN